MLAAQALQEPQEVDISEAYTKGFEDINYFAFIAIPEVMIYSFPPLYVAMWKMLVKAMVEHDLSRAKRVIRFALGLPRGFAKTTFIKVLICWLICYDLVTFVLVICATEPLAENLLADVDDMMSQEAMQQIYGYWTINKITDNKQLKTCTFRKKSIILAALGAGSSLRGLNIKHKRPDLVLCDDMQTKENDNSEAESLTLFRWFIGTLLKAINPFYCFICYIGNMYSTRCILYKLKESTHWISLITGCILADGKSLWEEVHPLESLMESFYHDEEMGEAATWMAELMNDPTSGKITLLPDGVFPVSPLSLEELQEPDAAYITIDPAGFRKISDDNVIAAHFVKDDVPYIVKMEGGLWNPEETITHAVEMALDLQIPVIAIETTAYQQSLKFWMERTLQERHIDWIHVVEISPKGRTKESRIRAFIQLCLAGKNYIAEKSAKAKLTWQALQYKLGRKDNKDDWLDAAAYGEDVRLNYWDLIMSFDRTKLPAAQARVVYNNTVF